jgi:hypothetical protein
MTEFYKKPQSHNKENQPAKFTPETLNDLRGFSADDTKYKINPKTWQIKLKKNPDEGQNNIFEKNNDTSLQVRTENYLNEQGLQIGLSIQKDLKIEICCYIVLYFKPTSIAELSNATRLYNILIRSKILTVASLLEIKDNLRSIKHIGELYEHYLKDFIEKYSKEQKAK